MKLLGVLVNVVGWLVAVGGLGLAQSNKGRALYAVAGIAIELFAIFGLINRAHNENAFWKTGHSPDQARGGR